MRRGVVRGKNRATSTSPTFPTIRQEAMGALNKYTDSLSRCLNVKWPINLSCKKCTHKAVNRKQAAYQNPKNNKLSHRKSRNVSAFHFPECFAEFAGLPPFRLSNAPCKTYTQSVNFLPYFMDLLPVNNLQTIRGLKLPNTLVCCILQSTSQTKLDAKALLQELCQHDPSCECLYVFFFH